MDNYIDLHTPCSSMYIHGKGQDFLCVGQYGGKIEGLGKRKSMLLKETKMSMMKKVRSS